MIILTTVVVPGSPLVVCSEIVLPWVFTVVNAAVGVGDSVVSATPVFWAGVVAWSVVAWSVVACGVESVAVVAPAVVRRVGLVAWSVVASGVVFDIIGVVPAEVVPNSVVPALVVRDGVAA